jgi:ABC-type multidrug transport system fused ATPase/permease subunit
LIVVNVSTVVKVTRHALGAFPMLYVAVVLSVLSAGTELVAMISLFPLVEIAAGRAIPPTSIWGGLSALFPGRAPVLVFLSFFLGMLIVRVATAALVALLSASLYRRMIAYFSANSFEAFVKHLSFSEIQKKTIGHFITLAGDEANRASQIVLATVRLIPTTLLALLYLLTLFAHSLWIGGTVTAILILVGLGIGGAFRRSRDLGARQQTESRALNTFFVDALSGLRTVRGFNAESYAASRYREMIQQYARTCFAVDSVNILGRALPALVLLTVAALGALAWLEADALSANLAFAMAAVVMVLRFFPLVGQGLDIAMRLMADLRAGENVAAVIDVGEGARMAPVHESAATMQAIRRIQFDRVTFSYVEQTPVLEDFSATFEPGRIYAIVGPSGSGKSTLVDLLLGFYSPSAGRVSANGIDIREIGFQAVRSRVAIVEQQARLLSDSVRHNLAFGRTVSVLELERAIRAARLEEVIAALPAGYDSPVMYQGSNFSGGQRQRIGIARALAKLVDVLILDESTAGLDPETRDALIENLRQLYHDKILIFLTHDQDVIAKADQVIVLKKWSERHIALAGEKMQVAP